MLDLSVFDEMISEGIRNDIRNLPSQTQEQQLKAQLDTQIGESNDDSSTDEEPVVQIYNKYDEVIMNIAKSEAEANPDIRKRGNKYYLTDKAPYIEGLPTNSQPTSPSELKAMLMSGEVEQTPQGYRATNKVSEMTKTKHTYKPSDLVNVYSYDGDLLDHKMSIKRCQKFVKQGIMVKYNDGYRYFKSKDGTKQLQQVTLSNGKTEMMSIDNLLDQVEGGYVVKDKNGYREKTAEEFAQSSFSNALRVANSEPFEYKNSPVATSTYIGANFSDRGTKEDTEAMFSGNQNAIKAHIESVKAGLQIYGIDKDIINSCKAYANSPEIEKRDKLRMKMQDAEDCKIALAEVDWSKDLNSEYFDENFSRFCRHFTADIGKHFGGWNRIKNIKVDNRRLIINGVLYRPHIKKELLEGFPIDARDMISSGHLADFFIWNRLRSMTAITEIDIDDQAYIIETVGETTGVGRNVGVNTFFRLAPSLIKLTIAGKTTDVNTKDTVQSAPIKRVMADAKRNFNLLDGWQLTGQGVYGVTDGVQNFTVNSFTNYVKNRGNKHFIPYAFGTVGRLIGATLGVGFNFFTHLAGGIGKGVKMLFTDAVTPNEDIPTGE